MNKTTRINITLTAIGIAALAVFVVTLTPAQAQSQYAAENEILYQMIESARQEQAAALKSIGRISEANAILSQEVKRAVQGVSKYQPRSDYSTPAPVNYQRDFPALVPKFGQVASCTVYRPGCWQN